MVKVIYMSLYIQGYIIKKLIKEGGFGSVYLAKRAKDNKVVAIKILNPKTASSLKHQMQFFNEVKLLKKLDHPYIIQIYEKLRDAPRPALTMEYFESETLKDLIIRKSDLIEKYGIKIFREIAEALKYLHDKKIIHKDLKPENILVNSKGEVRLIDFSIAEKLNIFSYFRKRIREGTPLYLAPEQIKRKHPDCRTDIFSLGATFYYAFTGKPHINASSDKALLQQQLRGVVTKLKKLNKEIPYQLDNVIMRMLKKKPEERYQSMAEMLFELNRFTTRDYLYIKEENKEKKGN